MKVFKYNINENQDFQYVIETEIIENCGEDFIENNVHQPDEDAFYMVATTEQHNKFMTIIFNDKFKDLYEGNAATVTDVTKDVLYNIDKYENLINYNSDENVLLNFFFSYVNKDDVLDKILECGIKSLNEFDKEILEA